MVTNLAFKDGDGEGPSPLNYLALTDEELLYMLAIMEGCTYMDIEAISIRNRLRVLAGSSPVNLVVDNTIATN
jgi:hypothetical protein